MFYKGIILDLDDTLYDYNTCHIVAITSVFNYISVLTNISISDIKETYSKITKQLKYELYSTASSHNKSIYFKQLLESFHIELSNVLLLEELYWDTFYDNMTCYLGVYDFIRWNKSLGKKIGILTDYETEYQIKKLKKLGLLEYIDIIVTSEEVGIEKPSIQMFQTILYKMKLQSDQVIMIGDNYEKDIQGANHANIFCYYFNLKSEIAYLRKECYVEFNNFTVLHVNMQNMYIELNKLKQISTYAGERFDLVQAGGGNTSVKIDNVVCIKASGISLAAVDIQHGYVMMDHQKLISDINSNNTKDVLHYNIFGNIKRGSIETFMHAILKTYTLHIHPIQINRILISKDAKKYCTEIYPEGLVIDYVTPGIKVCNEIQKKYNNENVIFLVNHGLIVTSDSIEELYSVLENVLQRFETYQNIDLERYKWTNKISNSIQSVFQVDSVSYFCEDIIINTYLKDKVELFKEKHTFPDALIYCGVDIIRKLDELDEYKKKYNEPPKIIIHQGFLYISAHSLQKCKEIEDVLKSNLMIIDTDYEKEYLSTEEICFLNNWDAEKYRKIL